MENAQGNSILDIYIQLGGLESRVGPPSYKTHFIKYFLIRRTSCDKNGKDHYTIYLKQ